MFLIHLWIKLSIHIKLFLTLLEQILPYQDYQAQPVESNYVTDLRSHAYSEDPLPLGREYYRQKSCLPTSGCSWKKSSALEAAPSSPDALVHALGKMRTKINTISVRPDYFSSHPTTASHMRKHPEAELDYGLDHSEHCYRRSGRFTAFSSHNDQSSGHCNEVYLFIILTTKLVTCISVFSLTRA
jgi:hypothetical protein